MIYKNSTDPIELKKISLQIFSLRAYMKSFVSEYVKHLEYTHLTIQELTSLFNLYYQDTFLFEHFPDEIEDRNALPPIKMLSNDENNENDEEDTNSKEKFGIPIKLSISEEEIAHGKTFFSDINIRSIGFFSTLSYLVGQSIVITFDLPHSFSLSAEVVYCKNYNVHSRIISTQRPSYRIHAAFTLSRRGEMTLLRNFLQSMEPEKK